MTVAPFVAALFLAAPPVENAAGYRAEIERWRNAREQGLKADDGWLTLVGLHWLKEGDNSFGSAADNALVFPASAPPHAGRFVHRAGKTTVWLEPGVAATIAGQPAAQRELSLGGGERRPDVLELGSLSMLVIKRGERYAIRLRDKDSPARRAFKGLPWFPIDERLRVSARFAPHPQPKQLQIATVLGTVTPMKSPGIVTFELQGKQLSLEPVFEGDDESELFFIFRDATARKETYGAGRFLYAAPPKDGVVVLDFNKATSPPCAYTEFATCPLPPKQNQLGVRIEAGERFSAH